MRKLKLQVQISVDGFVGGPNGEMDWLTWNWDSELMKYVSALHESIDCILLGRNMVPGFIEHWQAAISDPATEPFARIMVDTHKIIFSKSLQKTEPSWQNVEIENGDLVESINRLKNKAGKDIIVYGGARFVSSLIKEELIDELNLFVNPTAIGKGLPIFSDRTNLELVSSRSFDCGIVLVSYKPKSK